MTDYLSYKFNDTPQFVDTFDELPLWSAGFGLLLLKHLDCKPNLTILDIGSGAGFPIMEIAGRFGKTCKCYGLDVWTNANNRARQKTINYGLSNVEIIEGSAEKMPFDDNNFDLVVSNLGINNFDNPAVVFKQCNKILKPGGKLALTTNLNGHWKEFYNIFATTLKQTGKDDLVIKLKAQEEHRGTVESISELFTTNGFKVSRTYLDNFEMKFADGTAFLNHYFVKLGWLSSWIDLLPGEDITGLFTMLEENLNQHAQQCGGLTLTVPMAFIEGEKI